MSVDSLPTPKQAGTAESTTVCGLADNQVYFLAVETLDDAGNQSGVSNVVQANTGDPAPPGPVKDLESTSLEPRAVTLRFTAPGDDGDQGIAAAYDVRFSEAPITEVSWEAGKQLDAPGSPRPSGATETIRVFGLEPEKRFYLALRARDDAGKVSPISNNVSVTMPKDTVAPGVIQDLEIQAGVFSATLRWTAPGNDGAEGQAQSYAARFADTPITEASWAVATEVPVETTPQPAGGAEELELVGLPGDRVIWFSIRASDEQGNTSNVSNEAWDFVRREPRTWEVKPDGTGDAATVQAGIDTASPGDLVLVYPGTYYEQIDYRGKSIRLTSAAGPEATIIDGDMQLGYVVKFVSGETQEATLSGFTIRNGRGIQVPNVGGGGILIQDSNPLVTGNIITENQTEGSGAGVLCVGSSQATVTSPIIRANRIVENEARVQGGGIYCANYIAVEIRENEIRRNVVRDGDGGAISVRTTVSGTRILGNLIDGNQAGDHAGGILVVGLTPASAEISWNLISGNVSNHSSSTVDCGGALALAQIDAWVHHNTIVENTCLSGGGGGISVILEDGAPIIERNIIAYTKSGDAMFCGREGTATVVDNLFWDNTANDDVTCQSRSEENVYLNPMFCNPLEGDYSVAEESPAMTHPVAPLGAFPTPGCTTLTLSEYPSSRVRATITDCTL